MAEPTREQGYEGRLVSLAGIKGSPGLGRRAERFDITTAAATPISGLPANPARIAATIQVTAGTDRVSVYFGDTDGPYITLGLNDFLQIDYQLPWTGVITLQSAGINTVICNELTVQT